MPTIKLVDKTRIGAKVRKVYDMPMNPYQRLMACGTLPEMNAAITTLLSVHTQQALTVSPASDVKAS
jgi:hypothetical protein